jgi:ADP-heptose:LPS heptosyltransferase
VKILVIRRDNIGDLLCTTPLLTALRRRFPDAWIGVLTNSYAAPALANNPNVSEVLVYEKGKHLATLGGRIKALRRRLALIARLRKLRIDMALLPASGDQKSAERFARLSGAARIIRADDAPATGPHEVESAFRCAGQLGIDGPPPPMTLVPLTTLISSQIPEMPLPAGKGPLVGLHISARKPPQRWPVERFAELARRLHADSGARFLLFWAPGSADDPKHPGDDEKAWDLLCRLQGVPIAPMPTHRLEELIAGLSLCDRVVCSDGGAMHVAAALDKPIVCFFGNSSAERWHPWGVRYELLQPTSRDVTDVSVEDAFVAYQRLAHRARPGEPSSAPPSFVSARS